MSRRRKHVRDLVDDPCPELGDGDAVCLVVELRGGNHIEVRRAPPPPPPPRTPAPSCHSRRPTPPPPVPTHTPLTKPPPPLPPPNPSPPSAPQVEKPDATRTLCRVPSKFSKILWVRAGSHVVARFEAEAEADDAKVTGELVRVLYANQIKEMKKLPGVWPERFAAKEGGVETQADDVYDDDSALARGRRKTPSDGCASSSEEDDDLPPPNRNRPPPPEQSESEEESSDEEDG